MILVTGGTGLVGSHLMLRLLQQGKSVRALYRNNVSIRKTQALFGAYKMSELFKKIDWVCGDITEIPSLEPAFQNIEYVYHCAALISFDPSDEALLRKTNIEGTANIVNLSLSYNILKLCHVSSISALGDLKPHEVLINELTEWNPEKEHTDYAISKYGAEMEVWRGQQEGLAIAIVNPGIILGPGFWEKGSGEVFSHVRDGMSFYTKGITGFVSVTDLVNIMVALMEMDIVNERFVVNAQNLSFKDVLSAIAQAMNVKSPHIYANPLMTSVASKWDWMMAIFGKKRKLSKLGARSLHSKMQYSNDKIIAHLEYHFEDLTKCIVETVEIQSAIE